MWFCIISVLGTVYIIDTISYYVAGEVLERIRRGHGSHGRRTFWNKRCTWRHLTSAIKPVDAGGEERSDHGTDVVDPVVVPEHVLNVEVLGTEKQLAHDVGTKGPGRVHGSTGNGAGCKDVDYQGETDCQGSQLVLFGVNCTEKHSLDEDVSGDDLGGQSLEKNQLPSLFSLFLYLLPRDSLPTQGGAGSDCAVTFIWERDLKLEVRGKVQSSQVLTRTRSAPRTLPMSWETT